MESTTLSEIKDLLQTQAGYLRSIAAANDGGIALDTDMRPRKQLRIVLELDTARGENNPLEINNPFSSYYVETASDDSTVVKMSLTSPEAQNIRQYTSVRRKDAARFSLPIRAGYLTWDAQAGKTMTIIFYLGLEFIPGTINTAITGGVSISDGTAVDTLSPVTLTTTVGVIAASNADRKKLVISNLGSARIFIGDAAVTNDAGASPGIPVDPGMSYFWISQAAVSGIAASGSVIVSLTEFE